MLSGFASNSILAVIRTKYGACLTERNFRDMSALHSVPEVAAYLASRTRYGEAVSGLDLSGINRSGLERALRNFLLDEIYDVCRFEKSVGENMFTCIIRRLEVTELLSFMRLFISGNADKYTPRDNYIFDQMSEIDFPRLLLAKSLDDIIACVNESELVRILRAHSGNQMLSSDFTVVEALMMRYLYSFERDVMSRDFRGETRRDLMRGLSIRADMHNLVKIYRSKKYFAVSNDLLASELVETDEFVSGAMWKRLAASADEYEFFTLLRETRYGRYFADRNSNFDRTAKIIQNDYFRRRIRMSRNPAEVMLSYVCLMETEIANITMIIEGVRYSVPQTVFDKMLILE